MMTPSTATIAIQSIAVRTRRAIIENGIVEISAIGTSIEALNANQPTVFRLASVEVES